jgi:hypothetical protein
MTKLPAGCELHATDFDDLTSQSSGLSVSPKSFAFFNLGSDPALVAGLFSVSGECFVGDEVAIAFDRES